MHPKETISAFDLFLVERGLTLDALAIGGAALGLLGVIERETRDCDILYPALPEAIRRAAVEFAIETRRRGGELDDEWLNNGPSSLADVLPPDWINRVQMMSKVFALCDRGLDLQDCVALAPSPDELTEIAAWVERQDAHPNWPDHVRAVVADLQVRLRHGI